MSEHPGVRTHVRAQPFSVVVVVGRAAPDDTKAEFSLGLHVSRATYIPTFLACGIGGLYSALERMSTRDAITSGRCSE